MRAGVTVVDPATTWVDVDVELAPDVTLLPGTQLHGATRVGGGRGDRPGHHADRLRGRAAARSVVRTHGSARVIGAGATRRPVRLPAPGHACSARAARSARSSRPRTPRSATGAKVPHLSYVGDATIGEGSQHRRGHDLRQLRRRRQAPHRRSATTSGSAADNMFVAPVDDRRRRVHRRPARSSTRTSRRARSPSAAARQRNIEGWVARRAGRDAGGRGGARRAPRRRSADAPANGSAAPTTGQDRRGRDAAAMTGIKHDAARRT